jgi:hypothetical protein
MAETPSHGRSRGILWRSAYTVLLPRKTSALFCSMSGAGSGTERHGYLDERPLISITRPWIICGRTMPWGDLPQGVRSILPAPYWRNCAKNAIAVGRHPVKRARMPHRGVTGSNPRKPT